MWKALIRTNIICQTTTTVIFKFTAKTNKQTKDKTNQTKTTNEQRKQNTKNLSNAISKAHLQEKKHDVCSPLIYIF